MRLYDCMSVSVCACVRACALLRVCMCMCYTMWYFVLENINMCMNRLRLESRYKNVNLLESVQVFACKIVTRSWSKSHQFEIRM